MIAGDFKDTNIGTIPAEWDFVPLRTVTQKTHQRDPRKKPDEKFRYIDVSSVSNDRFVVQGWNDVVGQDAPSRARKAVKAGDTIFATVRPYLRNIAQVPIHLDDAIGSTGFCVIRANPKKADPDFLYFACLTEVFIERIVAKQRGSSYPAVSDKVVLGERIPLPPLDEQRRIAAVLTTIQQAIAAQEQVIQAAREVKRSLMHRLFTYGPYAEPQPTKETEIGEIPEHWKTAPIGNHVRIKSGGTPSRKNPQYWDGSIPWVKTTEIKYRIINHTEEAITQEGLNNSSANLFPSGTLLMAMYGQGVTRGRVGILGIEAATNQACAALFPDENLNKMYLYSYLTHAYERIRNFGHGANQKNLSAKIIETIPIPIPEEDEQQLIPTFLRAIDRKIAFEESRKNALKALFKSTLRQLMTGQIRIQSLLD